MWKAGRQFVAVGDAKEGRVIFSGHLQQQGADVRGSFRIEISGGFVSQQQGRLMNEGTAHGHALSFSAGKASRPLVQAMRKSHAVDQLQGAASNVYRRAKPGKRWQKDIFQHAALGQQLMVLKNKSDVLISKGCEATGGKPPWIFAQDFYETGRGLIQRPGQIEERTFTASRGTPDGNRGPGEDSQVDIFKDGNLAGGR